MASARSFGLALVLLTLAGCASETDDVGNVEGETITDPDPVAPPGCLRNRVAISVGSSNRNGLGVIQCSGKPDLAYVFTQKRDGSLAVVRRSSDYPAAIQDTFRKGIGVMLTSGLDVLNIRDLTRGLDDVGAARTEPDAEDQRELRLGAHKRICRTVARRGGVNLADPSSATLLANCVNVAPGAVLPQ
jgi:hypothetical protein